MTIFLLCTAAVFGIALAVGVGASTLAIVNHIVSLNNGVVSNDEKTLMTANQMLLRTAMVLLFLSSLGLLAFATQNLGLGAYTPSLLATWILLFILYCVMVLASLRYLPEVIALSLQAVTWYMLSIVTTLSTYSVVFTVTQFMTFYWLFVLVLLLGFSGLLAYYEGKRRTVIAKDAV